MTTAQLNHRAQAAGFGDADVRQLDGLANSAHSVAAYLGRHLGRDGYRLSLSHARVDLAGFSRGWSR